MKTDIKQMWKPSSDIEGWRSVNFADLAAIMRLLPPPPLTQDGLTHRFEGPNPHDTIYAIRAAFMKMLDATSPGGSPISIFHKDGRWHCACSLIPELNASSVTLYALLHAMADRVDMVKEQALTNAEMTRASVVNT